MAEPSAKTEKAAEKRMENGDQDGADVGRQILRQIAEKHAPELWGFVERLGIGPERKADSFESALVLVRWIQKMREEARYLMVSLYRELPPAALITIGEDRWLAECRYQMESEKEKETPDQFVPKSGEQTDETVDPKQALLAAQGVPPNFDK